MNGDSNQKSIAWHWISHFTLNSPFCIRARNQVNWTDLNYTKVVSYVQFDLGNMIRTYELRLITLYIVISVSECLSVCLSVCFLSVRSRISENKPPNFNKFSVHVTCGRDSVLFWRWCNTLFTSGFVDDVMFSHNRLNGQNLKDDAYFSSSSPGGATQATSAVSDCFLLWLYVWLDGCLQEG